MNYYWNLKSGIFLAKYVSFSKNKKLTKQVRGYQDEISQLKSNYSLVYKKIEKLTDMSLADFEANRKRDLHHFDTYLSKHESSSQNSSHSKIHHKIARGDGTHKHNAIDPNNDEFTLNGVTSTFVKIFTDTGESNKSINYTQTKNESQNLDATGSDLVKKYDFLNDDNEDRKADNVKILSLFDQLQNIKINSKAVE